MNIIYVARKIELSDKFKEKTQTKLSKLEKFFGEDTTAHITVSTLRELFIVEVTVKYNNMIFRAEKSESDKYAALDESIDTIVRQIRKNKTKLEKKIHKGFLDNFVNYQDHMEESSHKVVKYKRFSFKPMDVQEAILQMELLGHAFFVFRNVEDNSVNVVYKRKDGDYAVLESDN